MISRPNIPPPVLAAIAEHARATWPLECCGLVLADKDGVLTFRAIENIAGFTDLSARTSRDGYVMNPTELLSALEQTDQAGGRLVSIVHSHPDVGAYFSKEDRDMALGGGTEPLWPGVQYLVVSVRNGVVDDARLYTWETSRSDFREEQIIEIAQVS